LLLRGVEPQRVHEVGRVDEALVAELQAREQQLQMAEACQRESGRLGHQAQLLLKIVFGPPFIHPLPGKHVSNFRLTLLALPKPPLLRKKFPIFSEKKKVH